MAGDLEGTKDYWLLVTSFTISFLTCCVGLFQIIDKPFTAQGDFRWYLMLSIFWALYNMVPPSLFLFYCVKRGRTFEEFCSFCFVSGAWGLGLALLQGRARGCALASPGCKVEPPGAGSSWRSARPHPPTPQVGAFLVAIGGLACAWLVPADYNTGQVLGLSLQFFQAQQSGKLPRNFPVPWRQSANLWDSMILPNGKNYSLVGGWFDQGDGLKVSYTIATSIAMLSWSYADMRDGFTSSRTDDNMASTIRWGAEYLMKCHVTNITGVADMFVGQVRLASRRPPLPRALPHCARRRAAAAAAAAAADTPTPGAL
jgi:hypothetical protein